MKHTKTPPPAPPPCPKPERLLRIGRAALDALCIAAVLCAVLLFVAALVSTTTPGVVPSLFGRAGLTVYSASMEPTFSAGDVIVIDTTGRRAPTVGDIITYRDDLNGDGTQELNTHRIVQVVQGEDGTTGYITRGDANATCDDGVVTADRVVGRYVGIRLGGIGRVALFLRSPAGMFCCVLLPLIAFWVGAIVYLVRVLRRMAAERAASDE